MEQQNRNDMASPNIQTPVVRQQRADTTEIDLVEVFYLLLGHWWQIFLCLVLGAGIAFGVTKFLMTPLYEATSSIYIVSASNNSVVDLTDLQIGAQLTADYQELLLSRPLLEDVIKNLELMDAEGEKPMSTKALANMIQITNATDTRILDITVTSPDPRQAADIANELVEQACIYLPQIMETDEPNLVEEAIVRVLGLQDSEVPLVAIGSRIDPAKGEALVLLSAVDIDVPQLRRLLTEAGLPNLWIPKHTVRVEAIPVLATGKLDLGAIHRICANCQ